MQKNDEPIIIDQTYNVPIDTVWNAITDGDQMSKWFFENIREFKPKVGFQTQFNVQVEDRNYLHLWKVTDVISQKMIAYNWKYGNINGDSMVRFELYKENNLTRLKLTHEVLESFPQDIPEFKRENGVAGWTYFIQKSLKEFLDKAS